jgi:predicted Ser/Thr protein kinase
VAAEFAVLTRMRRPDPSRYERRLKEVVDGLTAVEKMDLYATGTAPKRLDEDDQKVLRANVKAIFNETDDEPDYEGRVGLSPRTMRTLLLDAAQSPEYKCVSPFALLNGIDALCKRTSEFDWLKLKALSGGYHDHAHFREKVRERLLDRIEGDMRAASGFIEEGQYSDLFNRYITHVSAYVKGEKLRNEVTGKDMDPDENLMSEVEGLLDISEEAKNHRDSIISRIAAWAIDHPGEEPAVQEIFPNHVKRLEKAAFAKLRKPFAQLLRNMVTLLREEGKGIEPTPKREAQETVERLFEFGYDEHSAADAASALLRERYADLIN